mmetsp:Transcript_19402/g.58560  ORF Transcript_19402/g.58560 Transcript_19402/m.58560 type:complete len:470 (-) Transcript_19402:431-1840(-)
MGRIGLQHNKLLMMGLINFSNLLCHSLFSILPAFFPQEAKTKGMSEDAVGIVFACFPAVIFLTSPFAGPFMSRHGKKWVYTTGLIVVSVSTMCFSFASYLPAGSPFATWCLFIRLLQGLGSAMEETAAYAIIAELDAQNVSLFMGLTEISTGLGYMVGPPLGGILFALGGFATPFMVLGLALLPAAALINYRLPPDDRKRSNDETKGDVSMKALMRNPQITLIALASMLANSDYAFLEPTLGDHAKSFGHAQSEAGIGMLFSISSVTYTLACPLIGILANRYAHRGRVCTGCCLVTSEQMLTQNAYPSPDEMSRERFGPRPIILTGLLLQLIGFLLIGPSPLLAMGPKLGLGQMVIALVLFGIGESMSMTPVMDDMMNSCGDLADASVNSLSSILAASFSLGQMVGPVVGTALTSRFSFPTACTAMALVLLLHTSAIFFIDAMPTRKGVRDGAYQELTALNPPEVASAD